MKNETKIVKQEIVGKDIKSILKCGKYDLCHFSDEIDLGCVNIMIDGEWEGFLECLTLNEAMQLTEKEITKLLSEV